VFYINYQLLQNKRKEEPDSRRRQWLTTSLTGLSQTKFLAALLLLTSAYDVVGLRKQTWW